ncbi:cell division topological specificity factor MinE [Celerinatantimonas diazotrophica]|uniref:Cell division topological specificity factor n=1 Tax=Celerinatantimonas diazotrophica TaxID=412034 RepID=A0A4R1JAH4_9GAMM|nr:cell division topological specificity factor MinE [Celerinatantimonas diazotrophica]TCK47618.1 cell division topological specificity factor MinE [Celerinatantimonas diazotrophica]CAG9296759.1 Cell division topological specificity factor [Celerinatantimonas diazotrophica]
MALIDYFRSSNKKGSAKLAKERLQIIVAHERSERSGPDYLPALKQDILQVIQRYVQIDPDQIQVSLDNKEADLSVLELNITLPEDNKSKGK